MRVIVGLRNPGAEYLATRHNIGAEAVANLASVYGVGWRRRPLRARCETAGLRVGNQRVLLGLPLRMMNVTGGSVSYLVKYHRVDHEDLLIVHDDIDLPFGRLRIRAGGGSGGHNGVKSVAKALGSPDFWRLKIGVGRPPRGMDPANYVLKRFRSSERRVIDQSVEGAAELAELWTKDPRGARQSAGEWRPSA
ncbi:MAG: aminoacyl-tRNA hydrolase [bacterium]|nr:aminoacyl-tRNA hydrolase [Acidimicrobiia bacterium]MCY4650156.1 aminoacyl-tRNA hydrolase [bacterium]